MFLKVFFLANFPNVFGWHKQMCNFHELMWEFWMTREWVSKFPCFVRISIYQGFSLPPFFPLFPNQTTSQIRKLPFYCLNNHLYTKQSLNLNWIRLVIIWVTYTLVLIILREDLTRVCYFQPIFLETNLTRSQLTIFFLI